MANPGIPRRIALVSGASYGIGSAVALALARDGFDVAVSATRAENVAHTLAQLGSVGVRTLGLPLDVRSVDSVQAAIERVTGTLGAIDVLVNNAGVPVNKLALETTPADWDNIIATNLTGTFYMSQAMGRHLVATGRGGLIINMGSTHGTSQLMRGAGGPGLRRGRAGTPGFPSGDHRRGSSPRRAVDPRSTESLHCAFSNRGPACFRSTGFHIPI